MPTTNPATDPRVLHIAKRTRAWAEALARRHGFPPDLCGLCATASAQLMLALRAKGYDAVFHENYGHCFVVLNGYIIDITATQFGKRNKVFIHQYPLPKRGEWKDYWWTRSKARTFNGVRRIQRRQDWFEIERAERYIKAARQ